MAVWLMYAYQPVYGPQMQKKLKNSSFTEDVIDLDIAINSEVKELAGLKSTDCSSTG